MPGSLWPRTAVCGEGDGFQRTPRARCRRVWRPKPLRSASHVGSSLLLSMLGIPFSPLHPRPSSRRRGPRFEPATLWMGGPRASRRAARTDLQQDAGHILALQERRWQCLDPSSWDFGLDRPPPAVFYCFCCRRCSGLLFAPPSQAQMMATGAKI